MICLCDIVVNFIPLAFYLELKFVRLGGKIFPGNRFMVSEVISEKPEKSEDEVGNVLRIGGGKLKTQVMGSMIPHYEL